MPSPAPRASWMPIGELSARVGVSTARLRAWERRYGLLKPRRTDGNYRMYSAVDEARVRLMQRYLGEGLAAAEAAELAVAARFSVVPGTATAVPPAEAAQAREEMRRALEGFDETSAQRALERLLAAFSPTTVMRDVLLPYMNDVGERWAAAHLSIAQEHFATGFFHARLLALARGWDRGLGPRAVLACGPGEQHALALICFGIALQQVGWRITYLGPDTPVPTIAQAADQIDAQLVVVAVTMQGRLADDAGALRDLAGRRRLALGGPGIGERLVEETGATLLAGDPITAAGTVSLQA